MLQGEAWLWLGQRLRHDDATVIQAFPLHVFDNPEPMLRVERDEVQRTLGRVQREVSGTTLSGTPLCQASQGRADTATLVRRSDGELPHARDIGSVVEWRPMRGRWRLQRHGPNEPLSVDSDDGLAVRETAPCGLGVLM